MHSICGDSASLAALASAGLTDGTLEETATLERLAELSARLLCRNRSRAAALAYGRALVNEKSAELDAAVTALLPSYFRHNSKSGGEEDEGQVWVSKVFLHGLPAAPGTTLCARFSLSEQASTLEDEVPLYDLSLKVLQVAPTGGRSFQCSFDLVDTPAASAGEFTLDETQRAKLAELKAMLGLTSARWTAVGVLGMMLAAAGCAQMETTGCFKEVLRAAREAHREELLAR